MAKANDNCNDLCGATSKNISHHALIGTSIGDYHFQPIILIVLPKLALKVDVSLLDIHAPTISHIY